MHNTISSFVSSLISKHPYPYFNLNTITSAADILSVDSYMSIYAWSGYERIRTPTPSFRTVQPNFRLVLGIPFYKYWLYQFVYISKNYKSLSPLISTTTSDNTDMQHSLLTFHLKYLRRSYVASPTAFLNLGLLCGHWWTRTTDLACKPSCSEPTEINPHYYFYWIYFCLNLDNACQSNKTQALTFCIKRLLYRDSTSRGSYNHR